MNDRDRLLRIFNKNTLSIDCYTAEEIKIAFAKADHSAGTEKEQLLYSRFFKECNSKDLKNLCSDFKVNVRDVKKIYITSPYGTLKDVAKVWNTKFRLKSIIVHKILPRDHDKYTEIDNFEIYELTPCIAYEMAIRNQDVLDIYKKYEKISNMMLEEKYLYKRYIAEHDLTFDEKYEYTIMQKHRTYSKLIDADYKIFIDDYINICTELDITHLKLLEEKLEDELINEYLIYPTGYYRKITGASYFYEDKILNSKKYASKFSKDGRSEGLILEEKIYDDFIHIEGLYSNSDKYSVNNIVPNFNRQVNDQEQITIPLNLALPLEEIVEYITRIKKQVKTKSPLELLEEELGKADNLTNLNANKKGKIYTLDATKGEKPQYKLADMLYIYDMKQQKFSNTAIIHAFDKHYKDKSTNMSDGTIREYLTIAEDYIEKKRYKELITGKSTFK